MRRQLASTVALIVLAALTSACQVPYGDTPTPDYEHMPAIAAVFLDDGQPAALFAPCTGTQVTDISVLDTRPLATSDPSNGIWTIHDSGSPDPVSQVRLLVAPAGWSTGTPMNPLISIGPAGSYDISATIPGRKTASVGFTLADLQALGTGQVWARSNGIDQPAAVSIADFTQTTAKMCAIKPA